MPTTRPALQEGEGRGARGGLHLDAMRGVGTRAGLKVPRRAAGLAA
jgi:hypothetical protein